jgi:D-alanyl-D-alanine carboxypeptidase/D-alanyl-D-alanine-endopeptidase (penicillin-binding protein 4)
MAGVRRRLLALAAAFLLLPASSASARVDDAALQRKLGRALAVPHVAPSRSGAVAVDLEAGTVLYGHNARLALEPASNEKLAVTFAALSVLGAGYRARTQVLGDGELAGTVWDGDVTLKGHGDPGLSSRGLRTLAAQLRRQGVRRVTGRVLGDESWFDGRRTAPGWRSSFFLNECEPLTALTVDRDRFRGRVSRTPALAAARGFRAALVRAGIAVDGGVATGRAPADAVELGAVLSSPLWRTIRFMNRESENFTAELLLKQLGAEELGRGTSAAGAAVVMRELAAAEIPLAGVRVVDGSGLSLADRLTPSALVGILRAAWGDLGMRTAFTASLPVAGVSGTLEDRMRRGPARGNVLAKTGTTREASALSGYVAGRYAFSIVQNGYPLSYWWARVAQDRFAEVLAAQ